MNQRQQEALAHAIAEEQLSDGSFANHSAPAGQPLGPHSTGRHTTFFTSIITGVIAQVPSAILMDAGQKAADWLLTQRAANWSFNYWARGAAEAKALPYPDDWDDTSCAVAAIKQMRPGAIGGEALANLVQLLTASEAEEGGPYRTWLVPTDAAPEWQDVDMAVNGNIGFMLSLEGVELPSLRALVEHALDAGKLRSPYYPSELPVLYFWSRWYRGARMEQLRELALGRLRDHPLHTLDRALAIVSALNWGANARSLRPELEALAGQPLAELLRAHPFCYDPAVQGQAYVAGTGALTAAVVLEAVNKFQAAAKRGRKTAPRSYHASEAAALHRRITELAVKEFAVGRDLQAAARQMCDRILHDDPAQQITLLPYMFRTALGPDGQKISDARVAQLGALNLLGWLAYTIYDDFLDGDGVQARLPAANLALRRVATGFASDAAGPEFATLAQRVLDQIEAANVWEVTHCRIADQADLLRVEPPDYGDLSRLAERSLGHALGPMAIMMQLGNTPVSATMQNLESFFRHYITARQLNDEAHDWKPDLQQGHLNVVGSRLLRAVSERGGNVEALYARMEQVFWESEIITVCKLTLRHAELARQALTGVGLADSGVMAVILEPVEVAARKALEQQPKTLEFLRFFDQHEK